MMTEKEMQLTRAAGERLLDTAKQYAMVKKYSDSATDLFRKEAALHNAAVRYFNTIDGIYEKSAATARPTASGKGRGRKR